MYKYLITLDKQHFWDICEYVGDVHVLSTCKRFRVHVVIHNWYLNDLQLLFYSFRGNMASVLSRLRFSKPVQYCKHHEWYTSCPECEGRAHCIV